MTHGGRTTALAVAGVLVAACTDAGPRERIFSVGTPVAEVAAPASANSEVALASESVACVVDSYFVQVHCLHRDGGAGTAWGREGQGPGEFSWIRSVVRGPEGTVAVVDGRLNRVTTFRPSGEHVSETQVPSLFGPDGPVGATFKGDYMQIGLPLVARQAEIDAASGEILWEREFPVRYPSCEPGSENEIQGSAFGVATGNGGMVFPDCDGHLVLFPDRDGDSTVVILRPGFPAELPNERDVAEFAEARQGSSWRSSTDADVEADMEAFRQEPKRWLLLAPATDADGRLWALTSRDHDEFSYIELYVGNEYAGTVRIADRVVGFDVLGNTLAVLVQRRLATGDPDGIEDRAVVWYDISGLPG